MLQPLITGQLLAEEIRVLTRINPSLYTTLYRYSFINMYVAFICVVRLNALPVVCRHLFM